LQNSAFDLGDKVHIRTVDSNRMTLQV